MGKKNAEKARFLLKSKMSGPLLVSVAVAAFAVGSVAVAGAFEKGTNESKANKQSSIQAKAWEVPSVQSSPGDPSTWSLPIRDYQVAGNEINSTLLSAARSKQTASCLESYGVPVPFRAPVSWAEVAPSGQNGPRNGMDVRYGDHDLAKVSAYGYGWPDDTGGSAEESAKSRGAAESGSQLDPETELALYGPDRSRKVKTASPLLLNGKAVPSQGCAGETEKMLTGRAVTQGVASTDEEAIDKLERQAWDKMHDDPRVLAVFNQWSSCMASKGFKYKDPWAANDDPRWAGGGAQSEAGIATAKADVTCRSEFQVNETMYQVESEWQRKLLEQNPQAASSARAYTQRVMKQVNQTLGR